MILFPLRLIFLTSAILLMLAVSIPFKLLGKDYDAYN